MGLEATRREGGRGIRDATDRRFRRSRRAHRGQPGRRRHRHGVPDPDPQAGPDLLVDASATSEFEAAGLLAGTTDLQARRRAQLGAALAASDPDRLLAILADQRLVALIGTRALAHAPMPGSFAAAVERAVAANRSRGLALAGLAGHLRERLA